MAYNIIIWNKNTRDRETGLFRDRKEAKDELDILKKHGHSIDHLIIITVEQGHKRTWKDERKLRSILN